MLTNLNAKTHSFKGAFLLVIFLLASTIALAIPNTITLQGKLTNKAGVSQTGTFNMQFRIYSILDFGYYNITENATLPNGSVIGVRNLTYINYTNILWEQNKSIATDANGVYDVILGGINLSFAEQYYFGITVEGDNESVPRVNLTSSPYSFRANISEALNPNQSYVVTNLSITGNASIGTGGTTLEISTQTFNLTKIGNINLANNVTLGDKITFRFGQIIDNLLSGWLAFTGSINITNNLSVSSNTFYADSTNNRIGIGTTSPDNKLTIKGNDLDANLPDSGLLHLNITDSYNNSATNFITLDHLLNAPSNASSNLVEGGIGIGILFRATNNDSELVNISFINATLVNARNGSEASALAFYTRTANGALTPRLVLNGSDVYLAPTGGNVGIGTYGAYNTLTVIGSVGVSGSLNATSINTTGSAYFAVNSGSVGVATTSPNYLLQVAAGTDGRSVNLSNVVYINGSSGNVGIGTRTPSHELDVTGNVSIKGNLSVDSNLSVDGSTFFVDSLGNVVGVGTTSPNDALEVIGNIRASGSINASRLNTTGTTLLAINSGSVGIGTTSPATLLQLAAASPELRLNSTNGGYIGLKTNSVSNADFDVQQNGTSRIYLNPSGNLGIGTTTPGQKLTVIGGVNITGGLNVSGDANVSSSFYVAGNTVIGDSTSDTLEINSQISSNLVPNNNARNLGSPSNFWYLAYIDRLTVNNFTAGSANISGTAFPAFTINANYSGNDGQDVALIFERGSPVTNAVLEWDSTNKRFHFNFPLTIDSNQNLTVDTSTLFVDGSIDRVGIGTTSPVDTLTVTGSVSTFGSLNATFINATTITATNINLPASSNSSLWNISGANIFPRYISGNVGIGTNAPTERLVVAGNANISGNLFANNVTIQGQNGSLWQPVYGTDDDLVMYLPFNAPNGSVQYDRSPYGNDGRLQGGIACNASLGKYGAACVFNNNTRDFIEITDSSLLTFSNKTFSVEAWINPSISPDDYDGVAGKWNNQAAGTKEWLFRFGTGDTIEFRLADSTTNFVIGRSTTATIPVGQWSYVVGTYDGLTSDAGVQIYINGVRADTTNLNDGTFNGMKDTTSKLFIGAVEDTVNGNFNFFNGTLDEVRIYKRALAPEEIRTHYLRGSGFGASGAITADKFRVVNTTGGRVLELNQSAFAVHTGGAERLKIDSSGNVGIATSTPSSTLQVAGTFNATQTLTSLRVTSDSNVVIHLE